jgi:hypothetical protein
MGPAPTLNSQLQKPLESWVTSAAEVLRLRILNTESTFICCSYTGQANELPETQWYAHPAGPNEPSQSQATFLTASAIPEVRTLQDEQDSNHAPLFLENLSGAR